MTTKPDTAAGEMGHERILHRWNIETTGTACGDFNAQHITTDLDKVNCDGCKPLASLPEPLSCDNASGQEVVNVPSSVPREPEGSRGLQCNCTLIAGAHTYADCVPLLNERTKRWNDQQGEGYSLAPREESARTEDSAAIQARSTFEVDPYDESESLVYACNLLDVAKQDWGDEWTEHDERVRAGLSAMITRRALQPTLPSTAVGCEDLLVQEGQPMYGGTCTSFTFTTPLAELVNTKIRTAYSRDRERWVRTDAKLPELNVEIDVWIRAAKDIDSYRMADVVCRYVRNEGWYWTRGESHGVYEGHALDEDGIEPEQITHWRLKPAPPKEEAQ